MEALEHSGDIVALNILGKWRCQSQDNRGIGYVEKWVVGIIKAIVGIAMGNS